MWSVVRPSWDGSKPFSGGGKAIVGAEIVAEYAHVRWDLRRGGLSGALAAVRRPDARDDPRDRAVGLRMGRAVDRTLGALPADSSCMVRALVLARLLARRSVGSTLVLGVQGGGDFTAHAWVEHRGEPLLAPGGYERGRLVEL